MSENINFIPANELPVAEGDEVSVLCVENGELKQKAASGLGGGGSTNYDLVIRVFPRYDEEEGRVYATCEIESGSYDAVIQKLDAGVLPTILLIENGTVYGNVAIKYVTEYDGAAWIKEDEFEGIEFYGYNFPYLFKPDGSIIADL